jgi:hypothetical protein
MRRRAEPAVFPPFGRRLNGFSKLVGRLTVPSATFLYRCEKGVFNTRHVSDRILRVLNIRCSSKSHRVCHLARIFVLI